ncbi:hypothetical protein [Acidiphilium multivorum]|uniref:hypothetical protein n=1 Tax=Acidiphilium multivorum TaxID=62140 RepID=UPI001F4C48B2|nr:hypothetical protein [Acidiphilium multivorum]
MTRLPPPARAIGLFLLLAGCAAPPPPAPPLRAAGLAGTVVAVRPVAPGARRIVLGALGVDTAPSAAPAAEYIVRLADGSVVSVVEPGPPTLRRGARVRVLRHPARLVPASR